MSKTIAYVLYPGLTALDLVGPLTVTATLGAFEPEYRTVTVARERGPVDSDMPVGLVPTATFDEVRDPFAVVVPGGQAGTFAACADESLLAWIREASSAAEVTASVCTGSLILGAAGLLRGRKATTHWGFRDLLPTFGATPVARRWVEDGDVITAAGVSAGIDMALHLVGRLAGAQAARRVQLMIEYDPQPPLGPVDWTAVDPAALRPYVHQTVNAGLPHDSALAARLLG
jgi:transcriptional regulator GlxA family with amidase domain